MRGYFSGYEANDSLSETFKASIIDGCGNATVMTPTDGSTFTYYIGDSSLSELFDMPFTVVPDFCTSELTASSQDSVINDLLMVDESVFMFM